MRGAQRVVLFLCPVLLFGLGFLKVARGVLWRLAPQSGVRLRLENLLDTLPHSVVQVVYLLCFFLPILALVFWLLLRRESRVLRIATLAGGASLSIRQSAVNRYLHECLQDLPFVRNVRVQATTGADGALAVQVRVWISATQQIDSLQQRMLVRVREVLQNSFGVQKLIEPEILIEAVAAGKNLQEEVQSDSPRVPSGIVPAAAVGATTAILAGEAQQPETPPQETASDRAEQPEEPQDEPFSSAFFETIRQGVEHNASAAQQPGDEASAPEVPAEDPAQTDTPEKPDEHPQ